MATLIGQTIGTDGFHMLGAVVNALARLGVIDEEELREMLELADSALEHVKAQLETQEWLEEKRRGI